MSNILTTNITFGDVRSGVQPKAAQTSASFCNAVLLRDFTIRLDGAPSTPARHAFKLSSRTCTCAFSGFFRCSIPMQAGSLPMHVQSSWHVSDKQYCCQMHTPWEICRKSTRPWIASSFMSSIPSPGEGVVALFLERFGMLMMAERVGASW